MLVESAARADVRSAVGRRAGGPQRPDRPGGGHPGVRDGERRADGRLPRLPHRRRPVPDRRRAGGGPGRTDPPTAAPRLQAVDAADLEPGRRRRRGHPAGQTCPARRQLLRPTVLPGHLARAGERRRPGTRVRHDCDRLPRHVPPRRSATPCRRRRPDRLRDELPGLSALHHRALVRRSLARTAVRRLDRGGQLQRTRRSVACSRLRLAGQPAVRLLAWLLRLLDRAGTRPAAHVGRVGRVLGRCRAGAVLRHGPPAASSVPAAARVGLLQLLRRARRSDQLRGIGGPETSVPEAHVVDPTREPSGRSGVGSAWTGATRCRSLSDGRRTEK